MLSPAQARADEDWLALSSSITMLCEADLMALDEDLQEVPWGAVADRQFTSPLSALGARFLFFLRPARRRSRLLRLSHHRRARPPTNIARSRVAAAHRPLERGLLRHGAVGAPHE